ncbi:MAG: TolC family protein [Prevotella sp.]|nr:TolC family protein [Prevotella sp.]
MNRKYILTTFSLLLCFFTSLHAKTWTLDECIQYAMDNNISLQKAGLTRQTNLETLKSSKAALFPSLSFSTSHNVAYNPWRANGTTTVTGSQVESSSSTTSYNGSYSVGANWTVWNGNRNTNTIKQNDIAEQVAEQDSITLARTIEEQIATLYIQILYSKEAVKVSKESLEAAKVNEERGMQMVKVGSMSKAECSQLSATRAQDEYNVVNAESSVLNYKRQLKALLQLMDDDADFDVADTDATDAMALQQIPALQSVYESAKANRPEMKTALLSVKSAELQQKIAKAQRYPTVSLNASAGTTNTSLSQNSWGDQIKNNFNVGAGVTVSVPIFDQRSSRTAINKANIQRQSALLDVQNEEVTLHSTIERYWIDANNYQNQYKAAKVSTTAAQESYDLLSEQFAVGLKNIVELQDGKTRLLSAKQSELQSKYMTILDIKMLELYKK